MEAENSRHHTAITTNTQRYIGGYQEATNLYKLGARYYDTTTGRFTQFDPAGQEVNPYSYATCNPVNGKDPTGLAWSASLCHTMAVFAASAALLGTTAGAIGFLGAELGVPAVLIPIGFGIDIGAGIIALAVAINCT